MNNILQIINICIGAIMGCLYFYQIIYVVIALIDKWRRRGREEKKTAHALHRYAVMIPARNEEGVIEHLIDSIKRQDYPGELIDIFVIADNCTDNTAEIARVSGAKVLERQSDRIGKGYALNFAIREIMDRHDKGYEAFVVFDADNLVDRNFFRAMNRQFDSGDRIITSYRSSKNFGTSWIASASALWYLRESRFLNAARNVLHSSCMISGTGFLVARDILEKNHGWKHHLLTEDIEFSVDSVVHGEKVAFCEEAVIYDEQPVTLRQFWAQRLRWAKGFYQVFRHYGAGLFESLLTGKAGNRRSCYDLLMTILPAMLITVLGLTVNLVFLLFGVGMGNTALSKYAAFTLGSTMVNFYLLFFAYGALTLLSERRMLFGATWKQVLKCMITFPIFMAMHIPMSVQALVCRVEWKPVVHTCSKSVSDLNL